MSDSSKTGSSAILGISGFSGSGKTTLIEKLVPQLQQDGLRIGVIKHVRMGDHRRSNALPAQQVKPDTDRLLKTGAMVVACCDQGEISNGSLRCTKSLKEAIESLGTACDLVLVEGFKNVVMDRIWLLKEGETAAPAGIVGIISTVAWSKDRLEMTLAVLRQWLK